MIKRTILLLFLSAFFAFNTHAKKQQPTKYTLIKPVKKYDDNHRPYTTTEVNQKTIDKLSEPLRALAALYACYIQSNCEYYDTTGAVICQLNAALGLGPQGSDEHIAILQKWFPGDKDAQSAIAQRCSVGMPGSSNFLEYRTLSLTTHLDTVTINYTYIRYSHGNTITLAKKDIACIKKDRIVFIKR